MKKKSKFFTAVLFLELLAVILMIVWSASRGFDFTDEGLYMQSFVFPKETFQIATFNHILSPIFNWFQFDIISIRYIRLFFTLLSGSLFAFSFYKFLQNRIFNKSNLSFSLYEFSFYILLGSFLSYAIFPQTLSYNTLTLICLQFIAALLFAYLLKKEFILSYHACIAFIIGAISTFLFFTKFTSVIVLLPLLFGFLLALYFIKMLSLRSYFMFASWYFFGIAISLLMYFFFIQDVDAWFYQVTNAIKTIESHEADFLINQYCLSLKYNFIQAITTKIYLPVLFSIYLLIHHKLSKKINVILGIISLSSLIVLIYHFSYFESGMGFAHNTSVPHVLITAVFLGLLMVFLWKNKITNLNKKSIVILTFMFIFPFAGSFGTGNPIFLNTLQYFFIWYAMLLLIALLILEKYKFLLILKGLLLISATVAMFQIHSGLIKHHYRLNKHLKYYNKPLSDLPIPNNIKVDEDTYALVKDLQTTLVNHKFEKGQAIIGMYKIAGLVYLLGGVSPGDPWYNSVNPLGACRKIKESKLDYKHAYFLEDLKHTQNKEFITCLNEIGVQFPQNYECVDTIANPYIKLAVWVPKNQ